MPTHKEADLITATGEMLVDDPAIESVEWHSIAFVATLCDAQKKMIGFRYDEDGAFEALLPEDVDAVLQSLAELQNAMLDDAGGTPWKQCLIQIAKPHYGLKMTYEYNDENRWTPKGASLDMAVFAKSLRPD